MSNELALSDSEIKDLRAAGYTVSEVIDTGQSGYAWQHPKSGAKQQDTNQPLRRTQAQASHDLSLYLSPDGPDILRPDWIQK
jgi:hypothetical protein